MEVVEFRCEYTKWSKLGWVTVIFPIYMVSLVEREQAVFQQVRIVVYNYAP